jgi:ketosteroid isomerase-like protein
MITTALLLFSLITGPGNMASTDASLMQSIRAVLTAYSRKDVDGVLERMLPEHPVMYGSSVNEVYNTPKGIRSLLASDYRQWDTSRFGELQNVNVEIDGTMATAFFDAPFSMNSHGHVLNVVIRFATVWRKAGGTWLLAQSANFVPTSGKSRSR